MNNAIPEAILSQLNRIRGIQGILFAGSRALGKANKNSDWDFYVLLKKGEPRWRKTWKYNDTWVEIFCNDETQISKVFHDDLKDGRGVATHMFAHGVIVQDTKQGTLKKLANTAKRNLRNGPKKPTTVEKNQINYNLSTFIQDVCDCKEDNNRADLLFNQAINGCVIYFYRLGCIWYPRPKDRLLDLAKRNKVISRYVESALIEKDWKKKTNKVVGLCKAIGKHYKLSLDGTIYIPPLKS